MVTIPNMLNIYVEYRVVSAEVKTMTRNQWTWLLVAATLILAAGVVAKLFWPM